MAEQPKYFDIEDYETGKKYRVEAYAPDATFDEAVDYLSTLPENELPQYELKTEAVQPTNPVKPVAPREGDYQMRGDNLLDFSPENKGLSNIDQRQLLALINNPNVSRDQVNQFLGARGRQYGDAEWAQVEQARQAGRGFDAVASDTMFEGMVDKEALAQEYAPESDGFFAQVGRSMMEGWSDPASLMNYLDRRKLDFFDVYEDQLRQQFPDATPEQLADLEDQYIGYMARLRGQAASEGVKNDDFVPWLIGQFGAIEPYDILPIGRAAKAATRGGRILEQGAVGVAAGAAGDVVGQGLAIADNAQDEFDPVRTAVSAGLSGALGSAGQGVAEVAARNTGSHTSAPAVEAGTIAVPTSRKFVNKEKNIRTKKYREELSVATNGVVNTVNTITENWTNRPEVVVHDNFTDLPDVPDNALGVYRADGTVILNTERILEKAQSRNVSPEAMTESVLFHEALGHNGLTQLFGDELDTFLGDVLDNIRPELRQRVDDWMAKRPNSYTDRDERWREVRALEEVIAIESEKGLVPQRFIDNVLNLIKDFARQMGINNLLIADTKYSSREIRAYLAVAQRRVTDGAPSSAAPGTAKDMVVYHGSGADFDEFDHSYMSSGEGQQVFGWGTYLTDEERIAKTYKEKLSQQDVSFDGRRGPVWQLRDMALNRAYELNLNEDAVNAAFTVKSQYYPNRDITGETVYHDYVAQVEDPDWSELSPGVRKEYDDAAEFVNSRYEVRYSGKTYKVEIPDDAKWLEWETPLSEQPELKKALEAQGIPVLNREQHEAVRARIKQVLSELKNPELTAPRERELDVEFDNLDRLLKDSIRSSSTGQNVYQRLVDILGDQKTASSVLREAGFTGNRYLANNLSRGRPRKNDGTDKFNYVVFDDKTPKIVDKYMTDPDDLTGDDLVNSKDAMQVLDAMMKGYTKQTISPDMIEQEAVARGVPPSAVTRWSGISPGELARRIVMYDIAMDKLDARASYYANKIRTQGLNDKDQAEYLKTLFTIGELGPKIFQEQSEIGRALAAVKRSTYTAKKARSTLDLLKQYDLEAFADPETFFKLMDAVDAEKAKAEAKGKGQRTFLSAFNLPRAIMSSMDLSAPMRQGIVFIGSKNYWKSFFKMFTFLGPSGEANYAQLMREITKHPNYGLMQAARMSFSDIDGKLSTREEDFQSDLARKIWGIGTAVKQSEQAYAGFLNKLRADMFNKYVEQFRKAGLFDGTTKDNDGNLILSPEEQELLRGLGSFINSGTGRAELPGGLQSMAPQLNALFFSPRLIQSRFNMLNPYFYYKLPAPVRKSAAISMMSFGGVAALTAGAIDLLFDEAEVEADPRSSDFGKIKVGNTRFDIGGGFLQYLTLGARTVSWLSGIEAVKTSTGELKKLGGNDYGATTYGETVVKFFRNKLSPNASFVVDYTMESNAIGEPFTWSGSLLSRIVPMHFQSVYEASKEYDPVTAAAVTAPGFFGVGVNIYTPTPINKEQELDTPETITFDGEEFELTEEEQKFFKETRNNYFRTFVEEYTLKTGKSWDDLTDIEKQEIIKDAKADAQYESRLDMIDELGL